MTKEELNNNIKILKDKKRRLQEKVNEYANGNIEDNCSIIIKMLDIDNELEDVNKQLDNYDYYTFGEGFTPYVLNMINKIENPDKDNQYEMVDFSNQDKKAYIDGWREYHHIVSVIAQKHDIELIKKQYFDCSKLSIDDYDLMIVPIINSINVLIVNLRTVPKYDYRDISWNNKPNTLSLRKEVFLEQFPYVAELLDSLFDYRLTNNVKDIDENIINNMMNDIIRKYTNNSKKKIKH